jgi:tetratricopeptide (TPR) repeat protein
VTTAEKGVTWALGLALAVCLLCGQAVADATVPTRAGAQTGAAFGRAGFAYLTGLRRFAALLLWNRLEPQFHEYYLGQPLKYQTFLLPNMNMVLLLDPQFIQAYYMAPWIVRDNGRAEDAIVIAREGVAANPDSGLLHTSLAQILYLEKRDETESVRQADLAMRPNQLWADATEQWQALKVLADIYAHAGLPQKADLALAVTRELEKSMGSAPGFRDPDQQF